MKLPSGEELLRIFIGESDRYEGKLHYEAIVHSAWQRGVADATVLRGLMGFDIDSRMHSKNTSAFIRFANSGRDC